MLQRVYAHAVISKHQMLKLRHYTKILDLDTTVPDSISKQFGVTASRLRTSSLTLLLHIKFTNERRCKKNAYTMVMGLLSYSFQKMQCHAAIITYFIYRLSLIIRAQNDYFFVFLEMLQNL